MSLSCSVELTFLANGIYRMARMIRQTPPRADFEADFVDKGQGANAERDDRFGCVCLPFFGESRLGNWSQGICYLLSYVLLTVWYAGDPPAWFSLLLRL